MVPARQLGVEWEQEALGEALTIAGGYPYVVQLIGDATWAAAGRPAPGAWITLDHVRAGRTAMAADLDALFRARWANATAGERELMHAMASLGDEHARRSDIARVLGVTSDSLSVPRARLLDKGFVQPRERGTLGFTIPGFAKFIRDLEEL